MDYKEQVALIRGLAYEWNKCSHITKIGGMKLEEFLLLTATAITDLLARAEAAEARAEKAERERDAAVKDMEALMWFSGEGCHICAHEIVIHKEPYVRSECALGNGAACCPTWRGRKED